MITLYGIKNCDTVKKARSWLDQTKLDYQFHDFRTDGLTAEQVQTWINTIGLDDLVNKRSTTWKALDAAIKADFNEDSAIEVIVANPTLIKRPLLETDKLQHVGFNADLYQQLLG